MATPEINTQIDMQQAPRTAAEHLHWKLVASGAALNIAGTFVGDHQLFTSVRQHLDPHASRLLDALLDLHRRACTMVGCEWMDAGTFEAATAWLEAGNGKLQ